jgi:tetratricopeptide (TPR) repeat protein
VVLVADDLQWADPASVAFLADLERLLDDTPLLAIYVARIPPPALIGGDELALGPLAADEARALITGIAPAADEPAVTAAVDRAAGNPFLLEELGRALREGRPALPDSAVAAAQEQLDRLGELSREIAGQAAVLGHAFEPTAIAWLSARRDTVGVAVAAALDDLCEQRILVADAGEGERLHYRFASPLVREVAYNEIPTGERRRLHAAAAAYLADRAGTDPGELRALAEHWERGGRPERARDAYRAAGDAALSRFAFGEAADALVRAESLTPAAAREPDLLIQAGLALDHTDGPAAESRFRAAAARLPGDDRRRALVFLHLGRLAAARSDNEEAIAKLRAGLAAVADDDVTTRAQLYANLGGLLGYVMNDNETGLELSERAVALLEDTPHRRELAFALGRLGGNYMRAGRWRDQLECNRRNLEIGRELGDLNHQIIAHINLGEVNKSLGEIDEAIEHTEAALALCHRTGSANTRALGLSNLGILLVERGEMTNAEKRLSRGLELGARTGYDRFFYETYAGLSRIHYLRGDLPAAEEWARKSVKVAIASGSEVSEGISLRFLAAARGARGELVQGLFHLRRAHACLAPRDLYEDARTEVVEARLLTLRDEPGDRDRAEALRAGAAATFERLGARLDRARLADPEDLR